MGFEAAAIEVIEGQDTTHDFTAFGGGMYGTVASLASGLPVAGADVVLVRPGTGAPATRAWPTVTDLNGQFAFPFLGRGDLPAHRGSAGYGAGGTLRRGDRR